MWIPLDQIEVGVRYFVELGAWVRAIGVWWGCGQRGSGVMVGGGGQGANSAKTGDGQKCITEYYSQH